MKGKKLPSSCDIYDIKSQFKDLKQMQRTTSQSYYWHFLFLWYECHLNQKGYKSESVIFEIGKNVYLVQIIDWASTTKGK